MKEALFYTLIFIGAGLSAGVLWIYWLDKKRWP